LQRIAGVDQGTIAEELGVVKGDFLISINGQPVLDIVDYEYLCAEERLVLLFARENGEEYEAEIEKDLYEPLGLSFESGLMSPVRSCKNHCIFCFIDQMPKGGRETLQFKDDDWRLSFIMGNYITLTNVDEAEFQRILDRRVSPLYISVHATDPQVRVRMMRNPNAGLLMQRLKRLYDAGLRFHCQIVCCPGVNDGEVLQKTMEDLAALMPAAQSVAVVPVGLTKFRQKLASLRVFTEEEARYTLSQVQAFANNCKRKAGSAFVFPADELILLAGEELPSYEAYEDFPQIENGVGLLRLFEREFMDELAERKPLRKRFSFDAAGGMLAHAFMKSLYQKLSGYGVDCTAHAIRNAYFGPTITVGGLITGQDLLAQLRGQLKSGLLLLPHNMLREREDVFLDGMTVSELSQALGVRVVPVRGGGDAWIQTIYDLAAK
jgi:putative radical SAM enzyme (TIGR03279 family)